MFLPLLADGPTSAELALSGFITLAVFLAVRGGWDRWQRQRTRRRLRIALGTDRQRRPPRRRAA